MLELVLSLMICTSDNAHTCRIHNVYFDSSYTIDQCYKELPKRISIALEDNEHIDGFTCGHAQKRPSI